MAAKNKKYRVVTAFKDLQDKDKVYNVGDNYPKPATKKVSAERIEELLTKLSKDGTHFIEEIKEDGQE